MLLDDIGISVVHVLIIRGNDRIGFVLGQGAHHHDRLFDYVIEYEKRQDCIEQVVDPQSIGSNDRVVATFTREMGVPENNFVVVAHSAKGLEKLWAEKR